LKPVISQEEATQWVEKEAALKDVFDKKLFSKL
jgi:hypothetical protein